MKKILPSITLGLLCLSSTAYGIAPKDLKGSSSYCAAVRGNGELMPAHWGSMGRIVENRGMPIAMAGGSSASITMFLMESIGISSFVNESDLNGNEVKEQRSLLIKSIEGYILSLSASKEGQAILAILKDKEVITGLMKDLNNNFKTLPAILNQENLFSHIKKTEELLKSADLKEIINPKILSYVRKTLQMAVPSAVSDEVSPVVLYRYSQVKQAVDNFLKFNAKTDKTLFFRPGVLDFKKIGSLFGRMADFYAGNNSRLNIKSSMKQFVQSCSFNSIGKTWQEIQSTPMGASGTCGELFSKSVLDFREQYDINKQIRVNEKIGKYMITFPTTSVLTADGAGKFEVENEKYKNNFDPNFGDSFKVDFSEFKFGYWGESQSLDIVKKSLEKNYSEDLKSKKFLSLGTGKWIEALSVSPAEPGLASILPIGKKKIGGKQVYSVGGWSDLHPTIVLKAAGCSNVVYITRQGGESKFAQGVLKKLTNVSGFDWNHWDDLSSDEISELNAKGNADDKDSNWSKLYNLANPDSSYSKSIETADSVWCTDWDSYSLTGGEGIDSDKVGLANIVASGYNAQLVSKDSSVKIPGCSAR